MPHRIFQEHGFTLSRRRRASSFPSREAEFLERDSSLRSSEWLFGGDSTKIRALAACIATAHGRQSASGGIPRRGAIWRKKRLVVYYAPLL